MTASTHATAGARLGARLPVAPPSALTEDEEFRLGELADEEPGADRSVEYGRGSALVRGPDNRHGRADLHAARNPAAVLRGNVSPKVAATPVLPSAAAAAAHSSGSGSGGRAGSPPPRAAAGGSAALPGSLEYFDDDAASSSSLSSRRDDDEYAAGSAAEDEDASDEDDASDDEDEAEDGNGTDAEPGGAAGGAGADASAPDWKTASKAKPLRDKGGGGRGGAGDSRPIANGAIRVPQLRVVDASVAGTNTNLGVMPTGQALALARQKGVDLVLVNAAAVPPVARLIALHKLLAAQKEAESERRRASKKTQPKEVRLTSRISRE